MLRFRALLILYRELWPVTVATTMLLWLLAGYPTLASEKFSSFITVFFWLRGTIQLVIWYLFRSFNRKGFVFYHHFGLSELQLAISLYVIDLLIFSVWICLMSLIIRHVN